MRKLSVPAAIAMAAAVWACPTTAQLNMSQLAHIPKSPCTTGDVWAIGERYMLMARRPAGFSIIDVQDPANPIVSDIVPPGYPAGRRSYGVGDIKSDGRYIFATNESSGGGVFVYDTATSVMNPTYVTLIADNRIDGGVHNCWVEGQTLYCVSNRTRYVEVYDISNLNSPQHLSTLGDTINSAWAHDVVVLDGRAYCSFLFGGFAIYDVTNPSSPTLLGQHNYADSFTHNAWPSEDRNYLYTTDENQVNGVGGAVRIWSIADPRNISQVGLYKIGSTANLVHNVHVRGDYLFTSYYKEGVRIASIRDDPTNPVEVAWFDTFAPSGPGCFGSSGSSQNYAGCWGVYPFSQFKVLVSDMDSGGYVFEMDPIQLSFSTPTPTVQAGNSLQLDMSYSNASAANIDAFGVVIATSLNGVPLFSPLVADGRALAGGQASPNVPFSLPIPAWFPSATIGFTAWSGFLNPTYFTESSEITVTIQ